MGSNWANTPGTTPGSDRAVKMQKSIAMGMTAPKSPRKVSVHLNGGKTGCAHVPGLTSR